MTALGTAVPDTIEDVFGRIAAHLPRELRVDALDGAVVPSAGDQLLNEWTISPDFLAGVRTAAVLVGLVARKDGVGVLLTQRTADLRDHAGQIAFPGGKMDPDDASPAATAIREAQEEIGLPPSSVHVLGYLDPYLTRTRFRVIPVVARIDPPFALRLNPAEVVDAFEVPFTFVMDAANHVIEQREWMGKLRSFYAISYNERRVWGVTAGILRLLYERLYLR